MEISALKEDCAQLITQREQLDKLKDELALEQIKFDTLKMKIIQILNDNELKTFASGEFKFTKVDKYNVSVTDEPKFREYLETQDLDHLRKVSYQTLQALYKDEMEKAIDNGKDDFEIPGLSIKSGFETLNIRKSK